MANYTPGEIRLAEVLLGQAKFTLLCWEHPEPIEVVAARCGVSVEEAQRRSSRQDEEAARHGRTIPSLRARVEFYQKLVDDISAGIVMRDEYPEPGAV